MSIIKAYVAYFDVLGFTEVVKSHRTTDLKQIDKRYSMVLMMQ